MNDLDIVELYWQRDEQAIQETKQKYEAYLSKIAYNILFDFEDSRECVNDTYIAAWKSMPKHRPNILSTYLGKIVRQISIDRFRKNNSKKRYTSEYALSLSEIEDCFSDKNTPEQELDLKFLDKAINTFIRSLQESDRNIFIGRYYYFDSIKTIAKYCGLSESNIKTTLYRTRKKLKEHLVKEGFNL